jgi:zinc protease
MKLQTIFPTFFCLLFLPLTVFAIPTIQHWETDNGAQVYYVPAPDLPMVDIEIVFDAGSARDGNKSGLAALTNGLLNEGAGGYSANQIAEHFANLGAEISNSVDRDMATFSLRSLTESELLEPALEMLSVLLAKPDFEPIPFQRVQQQMLANLQYQEQSPDDIATRAFYKAIYGTHPYANLPSGTMASVAKLTPEDVKAFHNRYYVAKNALIAIVGAVDRKAAESIANKLVNQVPIGKAALPLPPVAPLKIAKSININHPSTQTHILMGQPGIARGDVDYFSLYVGNYILGGSGLVSLLAEEVREKRGLAYSTYSYFSPQRVAGPFLASLETRNEKVQEALKILESTVRNFIETGPSEAALKKAKQGITGMFPLRIKNNSAILGYLAVIGFYHLPLDYLNKFNSNIEAVTLEMITDAFKRRVHPDKFVTISVGGVMSSTDFNNKYK